MSNARRIVLYGDYAARQAGRLEDLLGSGYAIQPVPSTMPAPDAAAALAAARAMVTNAFGQGDPPVPNLGFLQSPSAGMEGIDATALPPGCRVSAVGGHEIPMAEYAICTILDWQIGYRRQAGLVTGGMWSQRHWIKGEVHGEACGATLGIAGYGRIGRQIARRAAALGMRVRALSRWSRPDQDEPAVERFAIGRIADFLAGCDFVVVALPLDAQTQGIVDSSWFGRMDPGAVLINIGRGKVVDEAALYAALRDRRIRGATIDVWYNYPDSLETEVPMASFPFHELDNIVVTPHCSGRTDRMFARRWQEIATNLAGFFDGA